MEHLPLCPEGTTRCAVLVLLRRHRPSPTASGSRFTASAGRGGAKCPAAGTLTLARAPRRLTASPRHLASQIAREKVGDNDPVTQKVLKQLVEMKSKKKAMEEALVKIQRQADGPVDSLN